MMRSLCNSLMDVCFLEELRCIEVGVWLVVYMKNGVMTERKNQRPLSSITATRSAFLFPNSLEPHNEQTPCRTFYTHWSAQWR